MSRIAMENFPGIIWTVLGNDSKEGLGAIINCLASERYNPTSSEQLKLQKPRPLPIPNQGERVKLLVSKESRYYGNITVQYDNPSIDRTTPENCCAQQFRVYFNFGKNSYPERDFFI